MAKMFALRLNFVDVICDDSLENIFINGKKTGFKFDVRLSYYRGHFVSTIDEMGVKIDGEEIPTENIFFTLRGQEYAVAQLHSLVNEFWHITEPAQIRVFYPGGLTKGEHKVVHGNRGRQVHADRQQRGKGPRDQIRRKIWERQK